MTTLSAIAAQPVVAVQKAPPTGVGTLPLDAVLPTAPALAMVRAAASEDAGGGIRRVRAAVRVRGRGARADAGGGRDAAQRSAAEGRGRAGGRGL